MLAVCRVYDEGEGYFRIFPAAQGDQRKKLDPRTLADGGSS